MGLVYNTYLNSDKIFGCKNCKTHLASHDAIISRNFRGQHGKAYLFNAVVNISQSEAADRNMTTGRHTVRDIMCRQCKETVGWKYDKAYEPSEKYKEGKFILEAELLCTSSVERLLGPDLDRGVLVEELGKARGTGKAMAKDTMKAVVFKKPHVVAIEFRPIPKIKEPTDVVVRVIYTALCGSELHVFRGHQPSPTDFIMGHEFTGTVVETGSDVKNFKKGDQIVSPFTVSCGECFYCKQGYSSRCAKGALFGTAGLDGAQAEYVRVPLADSTAMKAPEGIADNALVLMADIFPTGWFAADNAFKDLTKEQISEATVVLVGCGPVGLCALINAENYKPKHLLAVDSIQSRLDLAKSLGAEPWNFQTDREGLDKRVKELTGGRGADVVIEVVGMSPALKMGFELLRPWGIISSVGVHNAEIPWSGNQAYGKNLRIQMGRCPVRSIFPQALEMLKRKQHLLGFMSDKIMPMSEAVEGYDLFDKMKVQKVVFEAEK
ncbi:MAG: hypothetical protein Q9175_003778 [Cornicularia normoerica]